MIRFKTHNSSKRIESLFFLCQRPVRAVMVTDDGDAGPMPRPAKGNAWTIYHLLSMFSAII